MIVAMKAVLDVSISVLDFKNRHEVNAIRDNGIEVTTVYACK
jgi:hypothetical protein